jgi:hypothetical protein
MVQLSLEVLLPTKSEFMFFFVVFLFIYLSLAMN